ncbi:hypothetical protein K402DRAFT_462890 [Aulographum hederae CBS 113979]|uniref:Mid2 domain-containing protein n=1 Tax=Aulographum hederae CBS 113979 TaxID=1176131 RepID=A0A6G1H1T8_9PEZI|nr:hypothetical protein K402DRAFT_462890 [Aulographum hederae CBS 113979]
MTLESGDQHTYYPGDTVTVSYDGVSENPANNRITLLSRSAEAYIFYAPSSDDGPGVVERSNIFNWDIDSTYPTDYYRFELMVNNTAAQTVWFKIKNDNFKSTTLATAYRTTTVISVRSKTVTSFYLSSSSETPTPTSTSNAIGDATSAASSPSSRLSFTEPTSPPVYDTHPRDMKGARVAIGVTVPLSIISITVLVWFLYRGYNKHVERKLDREEAVAREKAEALMKPKEGTVELDASPYYGTELPAPDITVELPTRPGTARTPEEEGGTGFLEEMRSRIASVGAHDSNGLDVAPDFRPVSALDIGDEEALTENGISRRISSVSRISNMEPERAPEAGAYSGSPRVLPEIPPKPISLRSRYPPPESQTQLDEFPLPPRAPPEIPRPSTSVSAMLTRDNLAHPRLRCVTNEDVYPMPERAAPDIPSPISCHEDDGLLQSNETASTVPMPHRMPPEVPR